MATHARTVAFDFDGALQLARLSWQSADELDRLRCERGGQAAAALTGWAGSYGVEFVRRVDTETQTALVLAEKLRAEATGWAEEWKQAMDQENWNRYQAACDRVRAGRSFVDDVVGFFGGHDDLPDTPAAAARPAPPSFTPTRTVADYSRS
jgi:hypothetical protein